MLASSPSMSNVASAYSSKSSVRGTTFFSFMEFHGLRTELRLCAENLQLCLCVKRLHARGAVTGFKNVPAPARQTPPINPENYTFRFPQDKKWVTQNSCPKVGRSFFGKKGQHFLDSIRSGLIIEYWLFLFLPKHSNSTACVLSKCDY